MGKFVDAHYGGGMPVGFNTWFVVIVTTVFSYIMPELPEFQLPVPSPIAQGVYGLPKAYLGPPTNQSLRKIPDPEIGRS